MDDESMEIFKNQIKIDKIRSDIRTGLHRHLHRHTLNLVKITIVIDKKEVINEDII